MTWTIDDTWIVTVGILAAMSCALLGNYLVLRRLSMMGDAISHTVLPGIAIAFLITQSRDNVPMFLGACALGILTALLVHTVHRFGNLDEGASMGVVFTSLFAVGLLLIQRGAKAVDLDPNCVLYGAIELVVFDTYTILGMEVPRAAAINGALLLVNAAFVLAFYKELKITAFDPQLATSMGINANVMHYALMTLVAATCVAAFESVGSIIVIAMLIVPGACAWLLTDRLGVMLILSLILAAMIAVLGHGAAIILPETGLDRILGAAEATTAGMMGTLAGVVFFGVALLAPRHGVISRMLHQSSLSMRITRDDVLGFLYRHEELDPDHSLRVNPVMIKKALNQGLLVDLALWDLRRRRYIRAGNQDLLLSEQGKRAAAELVRSHRLWEAYLVHELGLSPTRVHGTAERLEHVTDEEMRRRMERETGFPTHDPHDRKIPDEAKDEG